MGSGDKASTKQDYEKHPFQLALDQIVSHLHSSVESGLSSSQVSSNLSHYGENKLLGQGGVKWYSVLGKQVANAMILVRFVILLPKPCC